MKNPIILEGEPFDWEAAQQAPSPVDDEGNVNWYAAMGADPGIISCPSCDVSLWREGTKVQCPDCSQVFYILKNGDVKVEEER